MNYYTERLLRRMGTERDMKLVPQKQVLDHEVAPVAKEPGQRPEKADYFEHRDRVADLAGLSFALPQHRGHHDGRRS